MIGTSVIRPLPQLVGRTLLSPPLEQQPYVTCMTTMPVHAFGYEWIAKGYPFTSQDGEYGVCAHAAIWSIARYHNLRYGTDLQTTSGIIEAAGLRERPDKTARSDGLYAHDIVRAFRGIGLPALHYDIDDIPRTSNNTETAHTVIHRYLNSGIPVAVLSANHMVASFRRLYLAPLEGRRDGENLLAALRAYFKAGRNVSSAAAALGLNRRTLGKRLQTVERILGRPLASLAADLEVALSLETLEAEAPDR